MSVYNEVSESDLKYDFCFIQLTWIQRVPIILNNKHFAIFDRPRVNTRDAALNKIISNHLRKNYNEFKIEWYKLLRYKVVCLSTYLSQLNIPHLFTMAPNQITLFLEDSKFPNDIKDKFVEVPIERYCDENKFTRGEYGHPLEECNISYAKEIIIPKYKKLTNL